MHRRDAAPTTRRPTLARCLLAAAMLAPAIARAQLTEEESVQRALARPEVRDLLEGAVDVARADALRAGLWPNPVAGWSRESTRGGPNAATDDLATVSQGLDLSGRLGLRAEAGARGVDAARARGAAARLAMEVEVRLRFGEALAAARRVTAAREAVTRISELATAVGRRQAAGDASGYDRARLERERASFAARLAVEEADAARAAASLAGALGSESLPELAGEVLPAAALPGLEPLRAALASRPDLKALALEAEAGDLQGRAGGRGWLPELTLSGGYKGTTSGGERLDGFVVGISLPLPLFDRTQDEALRGAGRARAARAKLKLEAGLASAEVRGLHARAAGLAEAARRFRADTADGVRTMAASVEAAWRAGELGVLELVDAHRNALDAALQAVELELQARRARLDLDLATGGTTR